MLLFGKFYRLLIVIVIIVFCEINIKLFSASYTEWHSPHTQNFTLHFLFCKSFTVIYTKWYSASNIYYIWSTGVLDKETRQ